MSVCVATTGTLCREMLWLGWALGFGGVGRVVGGLRGVWLVCCDAVSRPVIGDLFNLFLVVDSAGVRNI
jgi:hypothetical protein